MKDLSTDDTVSDHSSHPYVRSLRAARVHTLLWSAKQLLNAAAKEAAGLDSTWPNAIRLIANAVRHEMHNASRCENDNAEYDIKK